MPEKIQVRMQDGQIISVTKGTPKEEVLAKYERYKASKMEQQTAGQLTEDIASNAGVGSTVGAVVDTALTGITGLASTAAGTVAGFGQWLGTGGKEGGLETMEKIQEAGTWKPRSEQGQRVMKLMEKGLMAMREKGQIVGNTVYDATESPLLASAAQTWTGGSVDALLALLGLRKGAVRTGKLKKIEDGLKAEEANAKAVAEHTVEYTPPDLTGPARPTGPTKAPGSDIPPVVDNPVPQTVTPKAALDATTETPTRRAVRDFTDPASLEDMAAQILKDTQVEQGFRELGLKNLQQKYPDRSNKSVNAGKFGQGGAVDPAVFVEGVKRIFAKVKGDKGKFKAALQQEMGKPMDAYAEALYKQLTAAKTRLEYGDAPAKAVSTSIAKGKDTVAGMSEGVERPGNYALETVGATEETSAIANMLINRGSPITWAETESAAQALGMTQKQIARLRSSTNDLHAKVVASSDYAQKQLNTIKEVANRAAQTGSDTDLYVLGEMMLSLGTVVDDAAGIASNTGRALNAAKILKNQGRVAESMLQVFETFKDQGNLRAMAEAITKLEGTDIINLAKVKPTKMGAAAEVYVNALLTSTLTHLRNISGNTAYLLYSVPQTYFAATLGKLPGYSKTNPISFREANAYASGIGMGLKDAAIAAAKVMRTNDPQIRSGGRAFTDTASKIETSAHQQFTAELLPDRLQGTALGKAFNVTGEAVRTPGRFLLAEDAFFKSLAYTMEVNRLAIRSARKAVAEGKIGKDGVKDFIADYKSSYHQEAMDWAHKMTFTKELGKMGRYLQNMANHHPAARFVAPFIRTPINLQKEALSGTPLAALHPEIRASIKAGGVDGTRALSHIMMGTALMYTIFDLAKEGKFIGSAPANPDARKVFNDKFGGAENAAILENGKAVSINGLGVADTLTGLAADAVAVQDYATKEQWEEVVKLLTASLTNNLLDKTFSQGIFDIVTGMTNPTQYGHRMMDYFNTFTMPRIAAQAARNQDPTIRTPRGYAPEDIPDDGSDPNLSAAKRIIDQIKRDVPGYREDLPPDYDLVGRVKLGHASWVNPFVAFDAQDNPVINELWNLKHTVRPPQNKIYGATLDKYQHADFKKYTGAVFNKLASRAMAASDWTSKPVGIRKKILSDLHVQAKKAGGAMVLQQHPVLMLRIPATYKHQAKQLMSYDVPKYFE